MAVERKHARELRRFLDAHATVRTCDQIGGFPRTRRRGWPSAEQLGSEPTALVTYDGRLAEAARKAGLPGAE